jgi:hypothetical protein
LILEGRQKELEILKIKVRPAGLEPATLCLEGSFRQVAKNPKFSKKIKLSYSSRFGLVVESC